MQVLMGLGSVVPDDGQGVVGAKGRPFSWVGRPDTLFNPPVRTTPQGWVRHYNNQREVAPGEGMNWRGRGVDVRALTGLGGASVDENEKFATDVNNAARNIIATGRAMHAMQVAGKTLPAAMLRAYTTDKMELANLLLNVCDTNPDRTISVPRELGLAASGSRARCFNFYELPVAGLGLWPAIIAGVVILSVSVAWIVSPEARAKAADIEQRTAMRAQAVQACLAAGGKDCDALLKQWSDQETPPEGDGDILSQIKGAIGWLVVGVAAVYVIPPVFAALQKRKAA